MMRDNVEKYMRMKKKAKIKVTLSNAFLFMELKNVPLSMAYLKSIIEIHYYVILCHFAEKL